MIQSGLVCGLLLAPLGSATADNQNRASSTNRGAQTGSYQDRTGASGQLNRNLQAQSNRPSDRNSAGFAGSNDSMNGDMARFAEDEGQSNTREFRERTAAIRREITDNDDLSTSAHNVRIVTNDSGNVILRGSVEDAEEKREIEKIARAHSSGATVQSLLQVNRDDD
jgi:osmotically-inducible protein OsmY